MLRQGLILIAVALIGPSYAQFFTVFEDTQAEDNPLGSATLVLGGGAVPFGRAAVYAVPSGACSLKIDLAADSGTLDVLLLPAAEYHRWFACRHDVDARRVLCRDASACSASPALPPEERRRHQVLLVGRSRIDCGGAERVRIRVTGSVGRCPDALCRVLRPSTPGTARRETIPYLPETLQPVEVPTCGPQAPLCWLNDTRTRSFQDAARQSHIHVANQTCAAWRACQSHLKLLGIAHSMHHGRRGLAATRDLPAGTNAMRVPQQAALAVPMVRNISCPFPEFVAPEWWDRAEGHVKLAVMLLWVKQRASQSPKAGWVADLPAKHDMPWRWRPADLLQLHYAPLAHKALEQRAEYRQAYADLKTATPGTNITSTELYWAIDTVKSRAFNSEEAGESINGFLTRAFGAAALMLASQSPRVSENVRLVMYCAVIAVILQGVFGSQNGKGHYSLVLVPGVDLVNHAVRPQDVTSDPAYNAFWQRFELRLRRPLQKGQEVFNTYGPRSNDNLLLSYGFVGGDNPDDNYVLDNLLQRLRALQHVPHSRLALLGDLRLAATLEQAVVGRSGYRDEVRPGFRVIYAPPELLPNATADAFRRPLPPAQEALVEQALHELLLAERDSRLSTLDEDLQLAALPEAVQLGQRHTLALRFRIEKKRVLAAAINATQPTALAEEVLLRGDQSSRDEDEPS